MVMLSLSLIRELQDIARTYARNETERRIRADADVTARRERAERETRAYLQKCPDGSAKLDDLVGVMTDSGLLATVFVGHMVDSSALVCEPSRTGSLFQDGTIVSLARTIT